MKICCLQANCSLFEFRKALAKCDLVRRVNSDRYLLLWPRRIRTSGVVWWNINLVSSSHSVRIPRPTNVQHQPLSGLILSPAVIRKALHTLINFSSTLFSLSLVRHSYYLYPPKPTVKFQNLEETILGPEINDSTSDLDGKGAVGGDSTEDSDAWLDGSIDFASEDDPTISVVA